MIYFSIIFSKFTNFIFLFPKTILQLFYCIIFAMKEKDLAVNLLKTLSVLYVEDEDNIRKDLTNTLELLCSKVYPFSSAKEALDFYNSQKTDIVLSDISLGDMNGIELVKAIRSKDKKTPVILLSAHTDTEYLLEAAKLKLVEYMRKPITFSELENSMVNAALEIISDGNYIVEFEGGLKYNVRQNLLYENNIEKKLSASEITLLNFLIKNKERTVSMQEIKNHIWDDPYYATDTAFKSLLHKLRSKIGKSSIRNVSGIGYYIVTK